MNRKKPEIKTLKNIGDALEEARKTYKETVEVPKLYIDALFIAQFFEQLLSDLLDIYIYYARLYLKKGNILYESKVDDNWTYRELIARLKNFIPENTNKSFYDLMEDANKKRNKFIHSSFKENRDGRNVITRMRKYHLSPTARLLAGEWIEVGLKAAKVLNDRFRALLSEQVKMRTKK